MPLKIVMQDRRPDDLEPPGAEANPFLTAAYTRYRAASGEAPCTLRVQGDDGAEHRLSGFRRRGRFGTRLEIPSLPVLGASPSWWAELLAELRSAGIVSLQAGSFASPAGAGPPPEIGAGRSRHEFVVALERDTDFQAGMSAGHRRNVRRADRAGLTLRTDGDADAHHRLGAASLLRRRDRGESTTTGIAAEDSRTAVRAGAARILQACSEGEVVSSIQLLVARTGAYYHSAGTSALGMSLGASPWLVHAVSTLLRDEGFRVFNLGGAEPENPGLWRFKESFGGEQIDTRAAAITLVPRLLRPLALFRRPSGS